METAIIPVAKNEMMPLPEIPRRKRSNIKPTAERPWARKKTALSKAQVKYCERKISEMKPLGRKLPKSYDFGSFPRSHDLPNETAHGFRRFALLLPGGVGVDAESESGVVVPQHTGHRFAAPGLRRYGGGRGI